MTIPEFITRAQGYYGRYTEEQKRTVIGWLKAQNQDAIKYIYAEVLKILSPIYKTPPCITELEEAYKVVKRERWNEVCPALPEPLPEKADPERLERVIKLIEDLAKGKRFKPEGKNES